MPLDRQGESLRRLDAYIRECISGSLVRAMRCPRRKGGMTQRDLHSDQSAPIWRSVIEGPRWAQFGKALRDRVWVDPNLELLSCEDEKGWLNTTTRFEVRGTKAAITQLQADLVRGVREYNADV